MTNSYFANVGRICEANLEDKVVCAVCNKNFWPSEENGSNSNAVDAKICSKCFWHSENTHNGEMPFFFDQNQITPLL
jgi:hypothetical protein